MLAPREAYAWGGSCATSMPRPPYDPDHTVRVTVGMKGDPRLQVWWMIDAQGNEISGSRHCGDAYKRNRLLGLSEPDRIGLPDPEVFCFVPYDPDQLRHAAEREPE